MWGLRSSENETIGLIAGGGDFPLAFAEAARDQGRRLLVIGVKKCTDPRIEGFGFETRYVDLGGVEDLVRHLKQTRVRRVVLAGSIPKKEIYNESFRPDAAAQGILAGSRNRGDDHLLRAFQAFLKLKCGVSVLDSRIFLQKGLAPKGVWTKNNPTPEQWADLKLGCRVVRTVGQMDIGQTLVVKRGIILAVEALEGTDEAIRRGGQLGGPGTVVVKITKPNQDLRFDLPCIGPKTIESLRGAGAAVLGVQSGRTIVLSRETLLRDADKAGIAIVGI